LKPMEILAKRNGNSFKKKWKFLQKEMEILEKKKWKKMEL